MDNKRRSSSGGYGSPRRNLNSLHEFRRNSTGRGKVRSRSISTSRCRGRGRSKGIGRGRYEGYRERDGQDSEREYSSLNPFDTPVQWNRSKKPRGYSEKGDKMSEKLCLYKDDEREIHHVNVEINENDVKGKRKRNGKEKEREYDPYGGVDPYGGNANTNMMRGGTLVQFPSYSMLPQGERPNSLEHPYWCLVCKVGEATYPKVKVVDHRNEEFLLECADSFRRRFKDDDTLLILNARKSLLKSGLTSAVILRNSHSAKVKVIPAKFQHVFIHILKICEEKEQCFFSRCLKSDDIPHCSACAVAKYCCDDHQAQAWYDEGHEQICEHLKIIEKLIKRNWRNPSNFNFRFIEELIAREDKQSN
mmetsp:Transcript_4294/g.5406  ORF Transcript_4294/g.5406 Transcript_4294/m.5406 type:complete len:362 (+) Transcript_4294:212-1297(+)